MQCPVDILPSRAILPGPILILTESAKGQKGKNICYKWPGGVRRQPNQELVLISHIQEEQVASTTDTAITSGDEVNSKKTRRLMGLRNVSFQERMRRRKKIWRPEVKRAKERPTLGTLVWILQKWDIAIFAARGEEQDYSYIANQ